MLRNASEHLKAHKMLYLLPHTTQNHNRQIDVLAHCRR
jgi:hypothetical protein